MGASSDLSPNPGTTHRHSIVAWLVNSASGNGTVMALCTWATFKCPWASDSSAGQQIRLSWWYMQRHSSWKENGHRCVWLSSPTFRPTQYLNTTVKNKMQLYLSFFQYPHCGISPLWGQRICAAPSMRSLLSEDWASRRRECVGLVKLLVEVSLAGWDSGWSRAYLREHTEDHIFGTNYVIKDRFYIISLRCRVPTKIDI